jgi:hypothetical protein
MAQDLSPRTARIAARSLPEPVRPVPQDALDVRDAPARPADVPAAGHRIRDWAAI